MNAGIKIQPPGNGQAQPFMTSDQYRAFGEKFIQQIKPALDNLRRARLRSEEAARWHRVG